MLKVGDKVRVVNDINYRDMIGKIGIIEDISDEDSYGDRRILVKFENHSDGYYSLFYENYGEVLEKVEELDNIVNIDDMNVYECIAYKLGLEIDEEFNIDGHDLVFKINNDGIQYRYSHSNEFSDSGMIGTILNEPHRIIKLPWRPKVGEDYYYINDLLQVVETHNEDLSIDSDYFKAGNFFKTKEEAEEKVAKIKELFNS